MSATRRLHASDAGVWALAAVVRSDGWRSRVRELHLVAGQTLADLRWAVSEVVGPQGAHAVWVEAVSPRGGLRPEEVVWG